MTTADRKMVPLPTTLVERIDRLRLTMSRPEFLDALCDEHEGVEPGKPPKKPKAKPLAPTEGRQRGRRGGVQPSTCPHPIGRRIGDKCALCGATVPSKK